MNVEKHNITYIPIEEEIQDVLKANREVGIMTLIDYEILRWLKSQGRA